VELSFASPTPELAPYISAYYRVYFDYPLIEDFERADVGYLRFMFSGSGFYTYPDGRRVPDCPVMLLGPASVTASYSLTGPLDTFGCVLLPEFWGGIIPATADSCANNACDGASLLGPDALNLFRRMKGMRDVAAMGKLMDEFLLPRINPLPEDHRAIIGKIGDWLSCMPIPAPEVLYEACNLSPRQVMRISNRYFGAPPKMLARKFRALRTASRLVGTKGAVPDSLSDDYADRAHMTREVKHFTGLTPRRLQVRSNPIMQMTLHPDNFRAEAPWT
jgi:AraC-like DNA-binding protein